MASWLKSNHVGYKSTTININDLNMLPNNNIPNPILKSIFKSKNIELTNAEHRKQMNKCKTNQTNKLDIEQIMETFSLINFDEIYIKQHEHMKNAINNLNNHQYLSYNHQTKMINEYNNPTLISCMFLNLFRSGINVTEMTNRLVKVSFQLHIKHLMNLDYTKYVFSKHYLFPFFVFNIIQQRQICLRAKLIVLNLSNISEHKLLNNFQLTNFDEIIKNPQNINDKTYVQSLLCHIKISNKYVMASKSSCASQKIKYLA
jgi:hypothetical protein